MTRQSSGLHGAAAGDAAAGGHGVVLPFYNRHDEVARCLGKLLAGAPADTRVVLVDDGSATRAEDDPAIAPLLADPRVTLLRHAVNRGVAAARNTGLGWCRREGLALVLMIDSDCEPPPDFVQAHLLLHAEHPEAACIGAAVVGTGRGFWARLDKVMTFVHALPYGPLREVRHPYHLGTLNFSAKLARLPARARVFEERLCTGEDALLIRELRRGGARILFSPVPVVVHHDRDTLGGMLWHHYQYGQHQYFVQFGGDFSPRCFAVPYRAAFVIAFLPVLPLFALVGSLLNLLPWLPHRPSYALLYPLMYLLWVAKGVAILQAALRPESVLRPVVPSAAAEGRGRAGRGPGGPAPGAGGTGVDVAASVAHNAGMATFMRPYESQTYALLRIVAGFLFLWHGMQKLLGFPGEAPAGAPAFVIWIAGPIELIGGALVMIGLFTRWAAFLSSGLMAFAYWMGHGTQALLPLLNRGELAALYCFVFLFIAARGPGIWSLDGDRA